MERSAESVDACVFFVPPSPSDTNPPLGPAILARTAANAGLRLNVRDLNIEYIDRFRTDQPSENIQVLGDQGKDRALVRMAARELFSQFGIQAGSGCPGMSKSLGPTETLQAIRRFRAASYDVHH
jgi:hypothetical protein